VLKLVKPRHFLPVHGEAAFLYAHAELAQNLGCRNTSVIRNGMMLGVSDIRNNEHVSMGTAAVPLPGRGGHARLSVARWARPP
jgi:mRNA degradation ribonuclease J1/J2